jgi:hypothetical protein
MVSPECSRKSGLCFDHHLRRPVGARPYHAAVDADIAGLHPMGNLRPVGGAAEIGRRNGAECAGAARGDGGKKKAARKGNFDRHASLPDRSTGCAESSDRPRKIM